jgi:pimeloyl-ACP methyl ester carboxylesterase
MPPERWIDVDGARTRYFDVGEGPPVVLVHAGVMGDLNSAASAEDWALNIDALARSHRVLALDRLGQGLSAVPADRPAWSTRGSIQHLAAFLKATRLPPCHLVGHAEGGYVVSRLTLEQPALVASCIIVSSHTTATNAGRDEMLNALVPLPPATRAAARSLYQLYSYKADHIDDSWLDAAEIIFNSEGNRSARKAMDAQGFRATVYHNDLLFDRTDFMTRLNAEGLSRPIMVMWGYNDPVAPIDQAHQLYRVLAAQQSRCQLHILNQAGHYCFRERPEEFCRVLAEFIEGVCHGD